MTFQRRRTAGLGVAAVACIGLWAATRPTGKFCLRFSGDGQYVEVPSAADLSFGPAGFSVSAWLRPETLEFPRNEGSGYVYWIGKGERTRQEWALRMYSFTNRENPPRPNRISFYLFNPDGGLGQGSYVQQPVQSGEWIQITAVASDGETTMYRNGEYIRCDEFNGPAGHGCRAHNERIQPMPGEAPLRIGTRDLKSFFKGCISHVRIWNRPLTADEVRRLFQNNHVPQQGLAADFPLGEGQGTTVQDATGHHQGSIVGAHWVKAQ